MRILDGELWGFAPGLQDTQVASERAREYRGTAKARKKVRAKGSTSVVSMNEQGVDIDGALGNSHLKWPAILQAAIYPQGVLTNAR
jgi:hypothetical protein